MCSSLSHGECHDRRTVSHRKLSGAVYGRERLRVSRQPRSLYCSGSVSEHGRLSVWYRRRWVLHLRQPLLGRSEPSPAHWTWCPINDKVWHLCPCGGTCVLVGACVCACVFLCGKCVCDRSWMVVFVLVLELVQLCAVRYDCVLCCVVVLLCCCAAVLLCRCAVCCALCPVPCAMCLCLCLCL